jgi:uncharacterized protein
MILKLIILAGLIYGVYYFFFKKPILGKNSSSNMPSDTVVECVECSTYVSTEEAIIKDGKYYCSKECAGTK